MVGDEDQSIYGFRAAYPQALTEFDRVYPHAKVLYMEQNYRSTEQIVAAADRFIRRIKIAAPSTCGLPVGAGRSSGRFRSMTGQRQYRYLCKMAENCETETAVLYRGQRQRSAADGPAGRSGTPYRCRQVESVFFTNRVVRDITDIIHLAQAPGNAEYFLNIYYKLGAGISRALAQEAAARPGQESPCWSTSHPPRRRPPGPGSSVGHFRLT